MVKEFNVLISGVHGQGVDVMTRLLGRAAVQDGVKVRGTDIEKLSVAEYPVFSTIRIGSEVYGPLIPVRKCNILLAMESSEALRNIIYLSRSSLVILNTRRIVPFAILLGKSKYPALEEILERLNRISARVITLNATQIAEEAGSPLVANIVVLGASFGTGKVPIKVENMRAVLETHFPVEEVQVNIRAFNLGYQACQQAVE